MPLEARKPVASHTTGLRKIELLPSKFELSDTSPNARQLQALCLRKRFPMSWPLARLTAELAFGEARA